MTNKGKRGAENASWKGGRRIGGDGYVYLKMPDHPRATTNGYVREHIVIVEAAMGKPLPLSADVHHFDENRANNANENLVACDGRSYHMLLHRRRAAFLACGNPSAFKCSMCKNYERQDDIAHYGSRHVHKECDRADQLRRYKTRTA